MKRFLCVAMAVVCALGMAACSGGEDGGASPSASGAASASASASANPAAGSSAASPSASASGTERETGTLTVDGQKLYMCTDNTDDKNVYYHLEDCAELAGKEATQVSMELIQMIGLRQCPVCNPPYIEPAAQ